jgi:hypothetical protein
MKFQDHDEFPECDHRAAPSRQGEKHRQDSRRPGSRTSFPRTPRQNWGKFKAHKWGGFTGRSEPLQRRPVARLDGLLTASVPEIALDHALIESVSLERLPPTQELADQVEAPPSAVTSEPVFGATRRVTAIEGIECKHGPAWRQKGCFIPAEAIERRFTC